MKEPITKFNLEAAFKALDELDLPTAGQLKANRPALTEIFSRKSKFDSLMEEYYDISNSSELDDAKEARDAEVAKAKLARIEKIVDLDADSPEDLLTSYVGKYIMQCPQCMTLFYKEPVDVVESEDDPNTINVNEICQHCGNESGYTLIGKVGEAEPDEFTDENAEPASTENEIPEEETSDEINEETPEENSDASEELGDLEELDLDIDDLEETEEEKTEESFKVHDGETLIEELAEDAELDAKLEAHNEYIEYLRTAIAQEETSLEKATNEQVKIAIQRNIDAFKADLENALPEAVKNYEAVEEDTTEEINDEPSEETTTEEKSEEVNESLTEALHEEAQVSDEEFEQLMNSSEFKKPISDIAVRAMLATEDAPAEKEESLDSIFSDVEELKEDILECMISDSLVEMYDNVAGFRLKECSCMNNKLIIEGVIQFTSGNTRNTTYTFNEAFITEDKVTLQGLNEKLGLDKQFHITGHTENKTFITESLKITKK